MQRLAKSPVLRFQMHPNSASLYPRNTIIASCINQRNLHQPLRTRGASLRVRGKKRDDEKQVVVPEELMIAKKALQSCLKKVEQAIELGDPAKTIVSQAELFQKVIKQQSEFLEKERAVWRQERTNWRNQESQLKDEIEKLRASVEKLKQTYRQPTPDPEIPQPQEASPRQEALDTVFATSVENSILAAMAAVDNEDVLSPSFNPVPSNGTKNEEAALEVDGPVEMMKSPPSGPPPSLSSGDDDIYWVSQLHEALNLKGFHCGDDDVEDFYFGEGTVSALLTYQACNGLEETGVTDEATWTSLLGPDLKPVIGSPPTESDAEDVPDEFPVLSELDGGKNVHYFQVLLEIAGYSCGKDDMEWWHFGDDTIAATKTFQACNDLPESGVADVLTWKKLCGEGKTMKDVVQCVKKENLFEEDMTKDDRVWLIGEQRWEKKI